MMPRDKTEVIHVVCGHCNSINRMDSKKLQQSPKCGRCHREIFVQKPLELNSENFSRHIEKNDIAVLVYFWAPWCGPCKMMAPQFEQAARMLEPRVRLAKVNTENEQALGVRYNIRSIPTLALFGKGQELARQSGLLSASDITAWVNYYIHA